MVQIEELSNSNSFWRCEFRVFGNLEFHSKCHFPFTSLRWSLFVYIYFSDIDLWIRTRCVGCIDVCDWNVGLVC